MVSLSELPRQVSLATYSPFDTVAAVLIQLKNDQIFDDEISDPLVLELVRSVGPFYDRDVR